jgi:hypothetical protein
VLAAIPYRPVDKVLRIHTRPVRAEEGAWREGRDAGGTSPYSTLGAKSPPPWLGSRGLRV